MINRPAFALHVTYTADLPDTDQAIFPYKIFQICYTAMLMCFSEVFRRLQVKVHTCTRSNMQFLTCNYLGMAVAAWQFGYNASNKRSVKQHEYYFDR